MKLTNSLIIFLFFLTACSGLKDAGKVLRNEKIRTTDEFLVKKKNPLVLPPNYDKIPEPGSVNKKKSSEQDKIKKILKATKTENVDKSKSLPVKKTILKKIRK